MLRRSWATIESSLERGAFRILRELPDLDPEELLARCEQLRAGMRMGAAS